MRFTKSGRKKSVENVLQHCCFASTAQAPAGCQIGVFRKPEWQYGPGPVKVGLAYDIVLALADHIPARVEVPGNGDIFRRLGRIDNSSRVRVVRTGVFALASIDCRSASEGEQRQKRGCSDEANHDVVEWD